ncbi:uncharacterized protein LOC100183890 [Ciona intestinalis]
MVKKLCTSFIESRLTQLEDVELIKNVGPILNRASYKLDFRLCNITNFMQETENFSHINPPQPDQVSLTPMVVKLDVSLNKITDLEKSDLDLFPHLRHLDASLNLLSTASGISACPKLLVLCLAYNKLKSLPADLFTNTKFLQYLDLKSNYLKNVPKFPVLPFLKFLDLGYNALKNLDGLQNLQSLVELNVKYNKLNSVVDLAVCTELKVINLSHNNLEDVKLLCGPLSHLPKLDQLDIKGNPVLLMNSTVDLEIYLVQNTTLTILNGEHVGPLKEQMLNMFKKVPYTSDDQPKNSLKTSFKVAVLEHLSNRQSTFELNIQYLQHKLQSLVVEQKAQQANGIAEMETWLRYIDTLSDSEAKQFTTTKLQELLNLSHNS